MSQVMVWLVAVVALVVVVVLVVVAVVQYYYYYPPHRDIPQIENNILLLHRHLLLDPNTN